MVQRSSNNAAETLEQFAEENGFYGVILPDGWLGPAYGDRRRITKVSTAGSHTDIEFDFDLVVRCEGPFSAERRPPKDDEFETERLAIWGFDRLETRSQSRANFTRFSSDGELVIVKY